MDGTHKTTHIEKLVYGDRYDKNSISYWDNNIEEINKDTWFITFTEEPTNSDTTSKPEGEIKRKRGRPRKITVIQEESDEKVEQPLQKRQKLASDKSRTDTLILNTGSNAQESNTEEKSNDEVIHALLATLNEDPVNYFEAMESEDKVKWQKAINEELLAMHKNHVWKIVKRPTAKPKTTSKPNILDSRWVLKRKQEKNGGDRFRARLVIRGFKDKNWYDLAETYAPVSRLPLVRTVIAILNKYNLDFVQLDL